MNDQLSQTPSDAPAGSPRPGRWYRFEFLTLALFLVVAGGAWAFAELADEVMEGSTRAFDESVLLALRVGDRPDQPIGPRWLENMARDCTSLGSWTVIGLLILGVCLFFFLQRRWQIPVLLLIASVGGVAVSQSLKLGFDRPRPELVAHGDVVYSASFPSGHAMLATTVYLVLGGLLAQISEPVRLKVFALTAALTIAVLIGFSRVYLGVHWPSDVLAGWTAGATWATLCWLTVRLLRARRRGTTCAG